jgi:hypothetical protein
MPEAKGVLEGLMDFSFRFVRHSKDVEISVRATLALCYPGQARSALAFDSQAEVVAASGPAIRLLHSSP